MDAIWIIPIAIVLLIVIGLLFLWQKGTKANMDRYDGDVEAAMSDDESSIPATPFIPDPVTALGDTPEAHAEINPHDIPIDAPERQAAEEQAAHETAETTGNAEGGAGGRFSRTTDETTERTGEPQRSAAYAKGGGGDPNDTGGIPAGEKTDVPGQRP
jgi:nitrogen fixation-related uncharacterized protein